VTCIGILAGGGRLPITIAESITARGGAVHIVGIEGEADAGIAGFPHTWVNWGQIGRMVATLHAEDARELVIAGGVRRPDLWRVRPDAGLFRNLPLIARLLVGGDDSVLKRVVRFFEGNGLTVRGVHEVAPDLLADAGQLGGSGIGRADLADAELGFAVRRALGPVDAGQAVVAARGRVLAIEGAEGTDAMLERVAGLSGRGAPAPRRGVLAKGPKPGQELRVDMPAIGPRTIELAAAAGLAGVAVEAGAVLVLERGETVRLADALGCALEGFARGTLPAAPAAAASPERTARVVGRRHPRRPDLADIETGLAAVEALAPYATGRGAMVLRRYVLAIEAAEGTAAMLQRAAASRRQWGLRWRRAGVLVRRVDGLDGAHDNADEAALRSLLAQVAALELAGIAVTGPPQALEPCEGLGRLADDLGLFLVLCEAA
jgi:DUF1009 family protein